MSEPEPQGGPAGATTAVTNFIKLAGAAVVLNEVFIEAAIRQEAIAIAALMIAGAQAFESALLSFFGRK